MQKLPVRATFRAARSLLGQRYTGGDKRPGGFGEECIKRVHYVHSTIAEAAGMSSWGVCITGLLRSLLHPLVHKSYAERIVAPLARAGVTVATHIVVVGKWAALNHTQLEQAIRDTYTVESLQLLAPQSPRYRCRPSQLGARHVLPSHVLAQFVAIRHCLAAVTRAEHSRGAPYAYLMRARTDIYWMEELPLAHILAAARYRAIVPQFGMGPPGTPAYFNDHLFVCPRALCRPFFELLEIFESEHCRENPDHADYQGRDLMLGAEQQTSARRLGSIFLTNHSLRHAPDRPFLLTHPRAGIDAQWYAVARYSASAQAANDAVDSRRCYCRSRYNPVCHCNGTRLAAVRWVYTIAGAEARAPTGDIFVNCGRPLWSGAKGKMVSAAVVACKAAVNASRQARLKEVAAWHNSAYMRSAAYSGDCHKRFSCSPTATQARKPFVAENRDIKPDGTPTRFEIRRRRFRSIR